MTVLIVSFTGKGWTSSHAILLHATWMEVILNVTLGTVEQWQKYYLGLKGPISIAMKLQDQRAQG